jgi:Asp-tRNA(Asn)/Glu-tRNA(Gln) amidotransferase A subunit family amidase
MSEPSATELAERLAAGAVSARAVTEACLARIAERDRDVRAFVHIDPDHARAQADAVDRHRKAGRPIGSLHGIPVALKDVVDTADMPTENGTPLDAGRRPRHDAALVARLRMAGAVIIGKTVTTEFAFMHPGETRNPHNTDHTPGGSSQGSAAAVADGMVPLAVGTQTAGSTIRPASYCGVVGMKPTHGLVSLSGVLTTCRPLDTAGVFARTVEDAALLVDALAGYDPSDDRTAPAAQPDLLAAARTNPLVPPRLAVIKGPTWNEASEDVVGLLEEAAEALGDGADAVDLPEAFHNAFPAHQRLMKVGFARNLRHYRERGEGAISDVMRAAMDEGAGISAVDYLSARDWQEVLRAGLDRIFERYNAILTPAAPGEAPKGLASTGVPHFNFLWTFVGAPCITLPVAKGSNGLPIGLQLVGRPGEDARLFSVARWLNARLAEG